MKSKITYLNGDHKIVFYACRSIAAGEELLFDYEYGNNGTFCPDWVEQKQKRSISGNESG